MPVAERLNTLLGFFGIFEMPVQFQLRKKIQKSIKTVQKERPIVKKFIRQSKNKSGFFEKN